jgi:23S rRNA pseudouridine2605 synthase
VNRLIRVSYGPFQLGTLKRGAVEQVKPKVLREQLGEDAPDGEAKRTGSAKPAAPRGKPKGPRPAQTTPRKPPRRTS